MTQWSGTNVKATPIGAQDGVSLWQQNTRMWVNGELQRRHGMAASNVPPSTNGIIGMATAFTPNGPIILQNDGQGTITGFQQPVAKWGDKYVIRPTGGAGGPAAPTIVAITATPSSPQPYPAGVIAFAPIITYDGLSGPLLYSWAQFVGPAAPTPSTSGVLAFSPNFDFFCIPGVYSFHLTINTTLHGFVNGPFNFNFTVS